MSKKIKVTKNTQELGTKPVGKLLSKLSLPAMMGMIVMALYNIVDTIFVGRGVGALAIGGLAIVLPIQMLVTSVAQTIGIGGASIISRALGSGQEAKANQAFGNLLSLIVLLSLFITPLMYFFTDEVLMLFGAKGDIFQHAKDYYSIVLWSGPFISLAMVGNNIIRAEGNAKVAMYTMMISGIINLILDPIFIFWLDMGIKGAAWATLISIAITDLYLIFYFKWGNSVFKLLKKNLILDKKIVSETLAVGSSSFARQASGSVMAVVLNHNLMIYGGELSVAAFGVINRVLMFAFMPMFGIVQGFMPIVGFNYGAQNFDRVNQVIKLSIKVTTWMGVVGMVAVLLFTKYLILMFSDDQELLSITKPAMQMIVVAFPLIGFQVISGGLFQSLGKALPALFLSLSRQVLFLIPLVLILPVFWGLNGVWIAFPLADSLAFVVTLFMIMPKIKQFAAAQEKADALVNTASVQT